MGPLLLSLFFADVVVVAVDVIIMFNSGKCREKLCLVFFLFFIKHRTHGSRLLKRRGVRKVKEAV